MSIIYSCDMNERYSNVQYDYPSQQAKYIQMMSNHDVNYPLTNNPSSSVPMPINNYNLDSLTSTMQNAALNNFGMDYLNSNKYSQNIRVQSTNYDRPNMSRFSNMPNSSLNGNKYNQHDQRIYANNMGLNAIHPMHMSVGNNPHNNGNNNIMINSPSMPHKNLDSELLIQNKDIQLESLKKRGSSNFYSSSNLKSVSQLQIENELEKPKWIVFPSVLQSATDLRQGKQHIYKNKKDENPISIDEELKKVFIDRISSSLISVNSKIGSKIPETVLQYTDITPIESTYEIRKSKAFNRASICYKAFDTLTEQFVLLRRFPGLILQFIKDSQSLEKYRKIKHPGLISISHVFMTESFEDNSTVFIMEYCPCSVTALQTHASDVGKLVGFASPFNINQQARPYSSSKKAADLNMLPEEKSWCYLIQLINIIRFVHNTQGLSCRLIDPSKILIQYPDRIRMNCFGVMDVLLSEEKGICLDNLPELLPQNNDLENLGQFMLCVICGTTVAIHDNDFAVSFDLLQRFYSSNLKTTIMKLVRSEFSSINEVAASTFAECYNHLTSMYLYIDYLELNLMKELECGRLFRLVCKLATICERNELGMDSNWSDYGANYQLKLFRDFVFHQVDSSGAPYLDLAHIVTCLNKLDGGSNDNVCLISRDGVNMFCVTFADLKKVLDESFEQLLSRRKDINAANPQPTSGI